MQNKIGFIRSYGAFWKYYADFSSRTPGEAFWKAWAVHSAVMLALMSPLYYIYYSLIEKGDLLASLWMLPLGAYSLATLVPTIAIILRRLHDTDRNGCWFFLYLIPYAGVVAFFIMLSRPSAPYDVYPGLSGRGPYSTPPPGGQPYGRPQSPGQPYGQPQSPGQSYGQPQSNYSRSQNPYSPSYGQQQNNYIHPQSPEQPYGQPQGPGQPDGQPKDNYINPQSTYAARPYTQQQFAPPPIYQRLQNPRRFAPPEGGAGAFAAIVVSIVLTVVTMAYSIVASSYLQSNINRYFDSLFSDSVWGDYFGGLYDGYDDWGGGYGNGDNFGWDEDEYYGWGDGDGDGWDYEDGYGHGGDGGYGMYEDEYMTEEKLAAIDLVRESTLAGFPDFTIEDVLLAYVNEEGLVWDCNTDDGDEPKDLFVTAFGIADGSFESVFADFFVYEDGSITLYDLGYGNRWENEKDAMELYAELYNGMMLKGEATI